MANRSRVLVTGGAGFIGRRVVRALLAEGHEVTVADLRAFPDPAVRSVIGDLCDPDVPARAVRPGTDVIIHLAAITSVLASVQDPVSTHRLNVDATARLLELARENEVETFLLASTNAVVGSGSAAGEVITERTVLRPLTPYGATKAAAEMLLGSYANCYGITGAALRFSNVYGPGMAEKDSFVPRLMRAARDGEGVQVRGDGSMLRDVVHVDDIVQGILAAWRARHNGPLILGAGQSVSVNDMVTTARLVTGAPIPAEHVPVGHGEMPAVVLDISAATALGYQPAYDLAAGMATVWPDFDPENPENRGLRKGRKRDLQTSAGPGGGRRRRQSVRGRLRRARHQPSPGRDRDRRLQRGRRHRPGHPGAARRGLRAGHGGHRGRRRLRRRHRGRGRRGRRHGLRRAGQPRSGRRAAARLPAGPGGQRQLHRDDRRGRPVQPGGDEHRAGAGGGRRGRLRHRLPAARQPGDQGHDPPHRRPVLRQHDQPADRAEDQRHDVRAAGHARRGHRRRRALPASVPGVRAAHWGHHPRLQGGRGARYHPPAAGG